MWHSQQPTCISGLTKHRFIDRTSIQLCMTHEACALSPSGFLSFFPSRGVVQAVCSIPFCQRSCCECFTIRSANNLGKADGDIEWSET